MAYEVFFNKDFDKFIKILLGDNRIEYEVNYALLTKVRKDNKFYTIGTKQLSVIFKDINDPFLVNMFDTIIDRLAILFEEYPTELEYGCDAILLEFFVIGKRDISKIKISNLTEAKEKLDPKTISQGIKAFNILGGFDMSKIASPLT